jgi:hypothetical protein
MVQEVYAPWDAPEFTCNHINTTATHCTFDQSVNGTLVPLDWGIRYLSTATAGDITYDVAISDIQNSTSEGIGQTDATAANERHSSVGNLGKVGKGFLNGTDFVLIHAAIPSDATYYINYTNNPAMTSNQTLINGQGSGAFYSGGSVAKGDNGVTVSSDEGSPSNKFLKIGSNATAKDWMVPTADSAVVLKSNTKQIKITMSEPVANINSTNTDFSVTRTSGAVVDVVPAILSAPNGTAFIYLTLQSPVSTGDVLTLAYNSDNDGDAVGIDKWITDAIDSTKYTTSEITDPTAAQHQATGIGNRMLNFTGLSITNWIPIGLYGNDSCYDCSAPTVTEVQVSLDGSTPVTVTNDNAVQINAGNGDTVSIMVTIADNVGADTMTFAGLYTNFGGAPDNLYYSNNFDSFKQYSTSYYEWNARTDDTAFGNTDAITWDAATATVNPDRTQTITYTMTINDSIDSTQVWVDLGDMANNYAKSALPITLEVAGPPALTFASDDSQQVVSYFNESILLAIVSQWTATSSDDASNVEQLSSVLGIEDQLPTWTTSLASWVSDDKIDVADMIVAVEYVINQ